MKNSNQAEKFREQVLRSQNKRPPAIEQSRVSVEKPRITPTQPTERIRIPERLPNADNGRKSSGRKRQYQYRMLSMSVPLPLDIVDIINKRADKLRKTVSEVLRCAIFENMETWK